MDNVIESLKATVELVTEGGEERLRRLLTISKLSLASTFGEFQRSHNEQLAQRMQALTNTRRCISEVNMQLGEITDSVQVLTGKVNRLLSTLHTLHVSCDVELTQEHGGAPCDTVAIQTGFDELRRLSSSLESILDSFHGCETTCLQLNVDTLKQLDITNAATTTMITKAQNDFDLQRLALSQSQRRLDSVRGQAHGDEQSEAVKFATVSVERAASSLQALGLSYVDAMKKAMRKTKYVLEQSSMGTWAAVGIFLKQLHLALNDLGRIALDAGNVVGVIKKAQAVSVAITAEKRGQTRKMPCEGDEGNGTTNLTREDRNAEATDVEVKNVATSLPVDSTANLLERHEGSSRQDLADDRRGGERHVDVRNLLD